MQADALDTGLAAVIDGLGHGPDAATAARAAEDASEDAVIGWEHERGTLIFVRSRQTMTEAQRGAAREALLSCLCTQREPRLEAYPTA